MTFDDYASIGGNSARRRGAGVAVARGGGVFDPLSARDAFAVSGRDL